METYDLAVSDNIALWIHQWRRILEAVLESGLATMSPGLTKEIAQWADKTNIAGWSDTAAQAFELISKDASLTQKARAYLELVACYETTMYSLALSEQARLTI